MDRKLTRNVLTKEQKSAVLAWVAEGLETPEINRRATVFEPPFFVSRAQVDYYRKTRKVNLKEISENDQYNALTTGLALKDERVRRLTLLASMLEEDIFGGSLWVNDVKGVGSGLAAEVVEFERFNAAEVEQYRGVIDDIAKEVSGRVQRNELTGAGGGPVEQVITVTLRGQE